MTASDRPAEGHLAVLRERGVSRVRLLHTGVDGVPRTAVLDLDAVRHAVLHGLPAPWAPDTRLRADVDALVMLPWENGTACVPAELVGSPEGTPPCPRASLRRAAARAAELGLRFRAGVEISFTLYAHALEDARARQWRTLTPATTHETPGAWGLQAGATGFHAALAHALDALELPVDMVFHGSAPGVVTARLRPADVLQAADRVVLFKHAVRETARRENLSASFMARPTTGAARLGCALVLSPWDAAGSDHAGLDAGGRASPVLLHAFAGLGETLGAMAALLCPTTNGSWHPDDLDETALRLVLPAPSEPVSAWHGVRADVAGSDVQPHLALAALVAMATQGIEKKTEHHGTLVRDGMMSARQLDLATSLEDATGRLRMSNTARQLLGAALVDAVVLARRVEVEALRRCVTDAELARWFERA